MAIEYQAILCYDGIGREVSESTIRDFAELNNGKVTSMVRNFKIHNLDPEEKNKKYGDLFTIIFEEDKNIDSFKADFKDSVISLHDLRRVALIAPKN
jgi:hypothetical protein